MKKNDINNAYDNFFIKLLTFFNKKSLSNLNTAYFSGKLSLPYTVFIYNVDMSKNTINDDWKYLAANSDCMSVLLYGISWALHTPAHILNEFDAFFKYRSDKENSIYAGTNGGVDLCIFIDIIVHILSIIPELIIMIINTIIGFIIALLCHPIDSICSIGGFLYFLIPTIISAVWEFVSTPFLIVYHILF